MSGELKAGFFVLAAIASLVFMTTRLTQNQFAFKGLKRYYAPVADATGLLSKTKVKMAGLDVGQIETIELAGKHARIVLQIASDIDVKKDASVAIKSIGFLGDKYVELFPGSDGSPSMAEGGTLAESATGGGIDALTSKTTAVVENLKEITDVLKEALKGGDTGDEDAGSRLDRILDNMEQFSAALASMDRIGDVADRLSEITGNIRDITDKVKNGEGTIGKLLTDTDTVDKLNSTLSGVNKIINRVDKLQFHFDARSSALTRIGGTNTRVSLILQPTYDKYYLFGVNSRPQGLKKITTTTTIPNPGTAGAAGSTVETQETEEGSFTFNAQFAKRWGDAVARVGIFENSGGVGVDYHLFDGKLRLTTEAYDFKPKDAFHWNLFGEYMVYQPFFVWAGGDDLLRSLNKSFLVGGGIRFSDQDLKTLIGTAAAARN